jgi:hypothetical protein
VIGANEVVAMGHIGPARKRYDVLAVPAAVDAPTSTPTSTPVSTPASTPTRTSEDPASGRAAATGLRGYDERRER